MEKSLAVLHKVELDKNKVRLLEKLRWIYCVNQFNVHSMLKLMKKMARIKLKDKCLTILMSSYSLGLDFLVLLTVETRTYIFSCTVVSLASHILQLQVFLPKFVH